jgi:hypothetical protein
MNEILPNPTRTSAEAQQFLQQGKQFADGLSSMVIDIASGKDFHLGLDLVEIRDSGAGSKLFELRHENESIGKIVISYSGPKSNEVRSIQLLSQDETKTTLLHEFSAGVRVRRGKSFSYSKGSDTVRFQKLTNFSDVTALLHEFGHSFEDERLKKLAFVTLAKKKIREELFGAVAADFVYLEKGSNFMNLVEDINKELKDLFPNEEDFTLDLQTPISQAGLTAIYQSEENAHLYSIERLIEIFQFLGIPRESEMFQKALEEQAEYAAVCLRTYKEDEADCLGFDPVKTITENRTAIVKFQIEPNDQVAA